ncbi:hypothetical protein WJX74_010654 [Apatococcus lobatus]|uniref:Peptidase S54 rhomboid domain-containing protein n=1 Tax=Apatococcus lobatus TaxID=904363 RepID=A0AAW1QBR4_9CHLO
MLSRLAGCSKRLAQKAEQGLVQLRACEESSCASRAFQSQPWSPARPHHTHLFRKPTTAFPPSFWRANSRSYYSYGNYGYQRPSSPQNAIYGLIAANVAGFLYWRVDPRFMARHATVSYSSLADGRIWTLVTAAFSHQDGWHLAANMFTFYFFASTIPHLYGSRALVGLYLTGAVIGNLAHVGWATLRAQQGMPRGSSRMERYGVEYRRRSSAPALGASGAINSIVIAQICLFPTQTVLLYGILPMPAALFGLLWIAGDVGGMLQGSGGNTSFAGHLGGATCGLVFYFLARRGFFWR